MGNKVKINVDFFTMLDLNESNKIESFEHGKKNDNFLQPDNHNFGRNWLNGSNNFIFHNGGYRRIE